MPDTTEAVLGALIEASHEMAPDDLGRCVREASRRLGATDATIYLVDLQQRMLFPLPAPGDEASDPLSVDGTAAGRAYITATPVIAPESTVWVAIVDGTDRLGVLRMTAPPEVADALAVEGRRLAGLIALLLVAKNAYTDLYRRVTRAAPMTLAAETQWGHIPPLTVITEMVSVSGIVEPAYNIGGDLFDYSLNSPLLHFGVFDAMGHDLRAARSAADVVASVRHSRRQDFDLVDTHRAADAIVASQHGGDAFVTAILAELDTRTGLLRWISAGHPRPILMRHGRPAGDLACDPSLPFGLGEDVRMVAETTLEPGDRVVLFSDGVTETRAHGEPFGEDRLADEIAKAVLAGLGPAETLRRSAHAILEHYDRALRDDFTILVVHFRPDR